MRYLLLLAICFSCNTAGTNNKQGDSSFVDGAKKLLPVQPAPVPPEKPMTRQDLSSEDSASWARTGFERPSEFREFLHAFKDWVKKDQVDSITAHIRFPLRNYKTPEAFKMAYPKVFDPSLKMIVEKQELDSFFRNYQGAMLGSGELWFNVTPQGYRITAINK